MKLKETIKDKIKKSDYRNHETKKHLLKRFILVVLIVLLYFVFMSFKYGIEQGILVTILTWTFFVFCTPIADAGFLLDFPLRIITKIKMLYSEIFVWIIAFGINVYMLLFNSEIYKKTALLKLFNHIILNPFPFWIIILLSGIGTFLSVYFGDELIDVVKHSQRKKYKKHKPKFLFVLILFIIVSIILIYFYLLKELGINFPF